MKKFTVILLLIVTLLSPLLAHSYPLSDEDLSLSVQAIILAVATGYTSTLLTPPIYFEQATFEKANNLSSFNYQVDSEDIGEMRLRILDAPSPQITPKGFFEMLFESIQSLLPSYMMMVNYLERQQVNENELYITGNMGVQRTAVTYPFRYEGSGEFTIWGTRINKTVHITFSFFIPLEGEQSGSVVLTSLTANDLDYSDAVRRIFSFQ